MKNDYGLCSRTTAFYGSQSPEEKQSWETIGLELFFNYGNADVSTMWCQGEPQALHATALVSWPPGTSGPVASPTHVTYAIGTGGQRVRRHNNELPLHPFIQMMLRHNREQWKDEGQVERIILINAQFIANLPNSEHLVFNIQFYLQFQLLYEEIFPNFCSETLAKCNGEEMEGKKFGFVVFIPKGLIKSPKGKPISIKASNTAIFQ